MISYEERIRECSHDEVQVFRLTGAGQDRYKRLCVVCWANMHGPGKMVPKRWLPPTEDRPELPVLRVGK